MPARKGCALPVLEFPGHRLVSVVPLYPLWCLWCLPSAGVWWGNGKIIHLGHIICCGIFFQLCHGQFLVSFFNDSSLLTPSSVILKAPWSPAAPLILQCQLRWWSAFLQLCGGAARTQRFGRHSWRNKSGVRLHLACLRSCFCTESAPQECMCDCVRAPSCVSRQHIHTQYGREHLVYTRPSGSARGIM